MFDKIRLHTVRHLPFRLPVALANSWPISGGSPNKIWNADPRFPGISFKRLLRRNFRCRDHGEYRLRLSRFRSGYNPSGLDTGPAGCFTEYPFIACGHAGTLGKTAETLDGDGENPGLLPHAHPLSHSWKGDGATAEASASKAVSGAMQKLGIS